MSLLGLGAAVGNAIAPWLGEWAIVGVAGKLTEGAIRRFKPDEMALLLKQSIATAEAAQPQTGALFDRCHYEGYKGIKDFLEQFFLSGEVRKELQKPLQDNGKPDLDILITAFKASAPQHPEAKDYLPASLPLWMETFVESYFAQIKGICFQVAKEQYLEQLARRVDDVKFVGIAVPGEEVEKQEVLAQIFVMPDVHEERSRSSQRLSSFGYYTDTPPEHLNAHKLMLRVQDRLEKQNQLLKEQKEWAMRDRSAPRIPAQTVINNQKKAVVLGAPGSGKTMLASYFALMLCQSNPGQIGLPAQDDYLPVVVRIRDWILQPNMGLLEYLRSNAEANLACKELPTGFFEHWLERGRALILLDGLDEVVDEAQRRKVAEQIETFLHQYQDNPAIITSRPAGYRWDFFNLDEFPHYTLESFDDKQVATFIDHWYDSRLKEDPAQADRRKADLQKAFARNERIRLLAKNPLLLTIITLIHRYQAELPRQRFKLYEKAVETLLTSWDSGKEIKLYDQVLLFLKPDDLLYILRKLAYWIHTQGSIGETEGGTLIDKDELLRQLQHEIKTLRKCEPHEAKGEAERFIDFIQRRTGLLNEQGRDRYGFVHKTFQEYLTAEEIFEIDESEEDPDIIWRHFREHLHDQHWREVLLLLVSKLKGKKAQKAIQTVFDANSDYEHWLHRDLLFAGWCLTEDPSRLVTVAPDFVGEILDRLVGLEVDDSERIGSRISGEAGKILHCLGETTLEQVLLEKLQAEGDRIDRFRLLEFQAALGQEEKAIDQLLALLKDKDSTVRERAIQLGYSINNQKVVSGVFSLLGDENALVGLYVSIFLRHCGNTNQELVNNLLSSLRDKNSNIRFQAVEALRQLENISENVVLALLPLLRDESPKVRSRVIEALGRLENPTEEIVNGLRSLLGDKDLGVQSRVIEVLSRLENPSEEVLNISMSLLRNGDFGVRWRVQASLIRENTSPQVVKFLKSLLEDENSNVRRNGVEVLGQLENPVEEIVNCLILLLEDKNSNVRQNVATTLIRWGNTSPEIVNTLLFLLEDESSHVRLNAAQTFVHQLGNSSPKVINTLLSLLEDCDSTVRLHAGYTLVNLGNGSPAMIDLWLSSFGNRDTNIRSNSVQALSKLAKKINTIRPKVVQWLEENPNNDGIGSAIDCLWSIVVE